jgi:uncharacterized membrane protein YesL
LSLFRINYDKPGPGIEKDRPPEKAFPRFFSILTRKFTDLIKLNLLFCIPVAVLSVLVFLLGNFIGTSYLTYLPYVFLSPFLGGLTFVTRNYAREEHSFIWYDFTNAVKNNWKAFLVNGVICYALIFIFSFSIQYYASKISQSPVYFVAMALCLAVALLLGFAQYYIPVMIVTFDLKITQIYRNALIFSIVGLWRNVLLTVLLAVFLLGLYLMQAMMLSFMIELLLFLLLIFSFGMLLVNFIVYPLVNKMMVQPYLQKHQDQDDNNTESSGK